MKPKLLWIVILMLVVARPAQAQDGEGTFIFGGAHGYVHNLGSVLKGWRLDITTVALLDQTGPLATCPVQVTVFIMQRNSFAKFHRLTRKRNAVLSTVVLPSARFDGDAVLFIQSQNIAHHCLGVVEVNVTAPETVQNLDGNMMLSDDWTLDDWTGDEVPEQSILVKDDAIPDDLRRLLLSIKRR